MISIFVFSIVGCGNSVNIKPATDTPSTATTTTTEKSVETSTQKVSTIAVCIPGPVQYFAAVKSGIDKAAKEFNVKIEYADAGWDAGKQLSQVEDFISKKVDMIAVCCVDAEAVKPAIKAANDAKIPIMAFTNAVGTNPTGEYEGLVTYVGQNEIESGAACGKMAKSLLGEKGGNVILIEGQPGTTPQRNRREGFLGEIKDQSNIKVVYTQTGKWSTEEAMKIVEDLIQKKQDMQLISCQDDNMAVGAGKAIKEAGLQGKVFVTGLGGSIAGLQALKDGIINGTTFMAASQEGYKSIEACAEFLKGEKIDPVIQLKQEPVSKDNVDQFKGEW
jgi:ABC-type sugar transport system, periplasmic component